MFRLLTILCLCGSVWALAEIPKLKKDGLAGPSRGKDVRPELSSAGRIQAKKDLRILQGNIAKVRRNLRTAQGNRKVLESELEELKGIRRSHIALKKRIAQYLQVADVSLKRNESARKDLRALEAKLLPQLEGEGDPALRSKAKEITSKAQKREDWKKDTKEKRTRVERLDRELDSNLSKVESRVPPLENQIQEWKEKISQLEGELDRMRLQERRLQAKSR